MINISGSSINMDSIAGEYSPASVERKILAILSSSSEIYNYNSIEQLKFELSLRKEILNAAVRLARSRFAFTTFRKSRCNEEFWERTEEGGFLLKPEVLPSDAIKDIIVHSSRYGTECSTAIVIVYYLALLEVFPKELFDKTFTRIYLMNWQHLDEKLGIKFTRDIPDYIPGDCRYFKNPDVDPLTPEWQGENVIDMGNGLYYGHGIGITNANRIIYSLNTHRKEGAETSAYLLEGATRPNFKALAELYYNTHPRSYPVWYNPQLSWYGYYGQPQF